MKKILLRISKFLKGHEHVFEGEIYTEYHNGIAAEFQRCSHAGCNVVDLSEKEQREFDKDTERIDKIIDEMKERRKDKTE